MAWSAARRFVHVNILCLGLSHRTAPVELRERLSFSAPALKAALARFGCGHEPRPAGLSEFVILSTCNRLEIYACASTSGDDHFSALIEFLAETRGLAPNEFVGHMYRLVGQTAIEHLCRVAAGLDSMILGEPQILGQVIEAHEAALGQGASGPVLSALFRTAIRAGKRARTETAISHNPASVSSVAVRLAARVVGDLAAARVLIVGAGDMAELAVKALHLRGVRQIAVINRTLERAAQLAARWSGSALTFEQMEDALAEADIVIASTGAPHLVITEGLARAALARRAGRPIVFVDIAVPRDVDPEVKRLPNAHCYDIDDLQAHLAGGVAEREREAPRVEAIVADEVERFMAWLRGLEIAPVIADLRAKADAIRRAEVQKTLHHLSHLGQAERNRIDALTEALVNKLLHDPTLRLKAVAGSGYGPEYAAVVRHLFSLNE